jgi:L-fucose mutarotase
VLTTELLHPQILAALGRAGHGSRVLIADGNYPVATTRGPNAELVWLNLAPGVVDCVQVLDAVAASVPIEAAAVMDYARGGAYALAADPPVWREFEGVLARRRVRIELDRIERFAFYRHAHEPDVALVVATGETRIYANVLLTIGVRRSEP